MNKPRRELNDMSRRDYCSTLAQRRHISGILRDGYDMGVSAFSGEDFSVSLYTSDLPTPLTTPNRKYLQQEHSYTEMNALFGHIAVNAVIDIVQDDDQFIVTLLRELPTEPREEE